MSDQQTQTHANIIDPDVYVDGVPHATFKRLRDDDPVSWWDETDGGSGFWAVTRYDDILTVSRNSAIFCSAKGIRLEEMDAEELEARKTMMEMDPPEHTIYRRFVSPPFRPKSVQTYEEQLRVLAREVIGQVRDRTEFDFVTEIARQLPMRMLGSMLGVPDEDGPWLVDMGDALIGNTDPEFTDFPVDQVDTEAYRLMPFRSPLSYNLFEYAEKQAADRRRNPRDDLITRLLEVKQDGETLSDLELNNFFALMVAAGNDTTRYTMAAGLKALLDHPDQLAELRDNPAIMKTAVEEILRWGSVTMHFRRTATEDTELSGQAIKAGDKVVIWFISGDFDERQFPDPFRFDLKRTPNRHMAFGLKSPHQCIGEHLARLEIKVLFEELLPLIKDIQLNGPIERLRSNFIAGIKHLPVKVTWV
ncbi:MAG: cytochrome P450 [Anaerolineae bacterium]|nr:cytochrome P450 [Anaerolineae bacterium]